MYQGAEADLLLPLVREATLDAGDNKDGDATMFGLSLLARLYYWQYGETQTAQKMIQLLIRRAVLHSSRYFHIMGTILLGRLSLDLSEDGSEGPGLLAGR